MGSRFVFWLPDEQEWVVPKLKQLQRQYEDLGVPISAGEICRRILVFALSLDQADLVEILQSAPKKTEQEDNPDSKDC